MSEDKEEKDTTYKNYIDPKEYSKEIEKWKESGEISDRLGELFLLHAVNKTYSQRFINYTWHDEMISRAVLYLCKYAHNFDPDKGNAWSYCDRIIYNAFIQVINDEKKQSKIKEDMTKSYQESFRDRRKNVNKKVEHEKKRRKKDEENEMI